MILFVGDQASAKELFGVFVRLNEVFL